MDPPRRSMSVCCELHPQEQTSFAGASFCPSCLRDRLQGLDDSLSSSQAPRRSTSSLRLTSLFTSNNNNPLPNPSFNSSSAAVGAGTGTGTSAASLSHLRRCNSFSAASTRPTRGRNRRAIPIQTQTQTQQPEEEEDIDDGVQPMKIHLDLQAKRSNNSPSSNFLVRKWQQWRSKHKQQHTNADTKHNHQIQPDHSNSNPRFSVDHLPPRFSLDHHQDQNQDQPPRASWDAFSSSYSYSSTRPPLGSSRFHPVLSAAADCSPNSASIPRYDYQIPVEDDNSSSSVPGSQAQTRDYYLDSSSSSRRRRSFERSVSVRKALSHVEIESEHRSVPAFNSKVSPAGNAEFYHHALPTRDIMSGSFDSVFPDPCKPQVVADKKPPKKSKGWNLWGLIQRKGNGKDQSANCNVSTNHPDHFPRCNSSVSARSSFSSYNAAASIRRNSVDMININTSHSNTNKRRDEFVLERNRSARFSPAHVDNGMLRFYLAPMKGTQSGRRNSVSTGGSQTNSARSVQRFY